MFNNGMMGMIPSLADIAAVTGNRNGNGWGDGCGAWWIIVIPGVFLITVLVCVTAVGSWLRRVSDRRQSNL